MMSIFCIFRSDCPRLCYVDLGIPPYPKPQEREYPLGWERIVLLGSSRGFLCVANVADDQIALWSPTTGTCNLLPRPARIDLLGPTACVYGFGYYGSDDHNCLPNEYVLLRVVQTLRSPILSVVSIYRSNANAWSWLDRILPFYLIEPGRMGVYAHRCLYWIMRADQSCISAKVLVAFHFLTNSFEEVQMDNNIDRRHRMDLAPLGTDLCVIVYGEPGVVNLWLYRKYSFILFWDPLFSLSQSSFQTVRPLTFSRARTLVLVEVVEVGSETKTLHLYNISTREAEQFHIHPDMPKFFDAGTRLVRLPG